MESLYTIVVIALVWLIFCVVMWRLHRARQHTSVTADTSILIAYASQTGNAQAIANSCAQALQLSEMANVIPLNNISLEHLKSVSRVLFVVSTYGDGEAPDNGNLFSKLLADLSNNTIDENVELSHLSYSVIALGDTDYPKFCAFGYHVHDMLAGLNAQPLSEVNTVDKYDAQFTSLTSIIPSWLAISDIEISKQKNTSIEKSAETHYWQLLERELLNPGCDDESLFSIRLQSIGACPVWQAGDLIDIQPKNPIKVVEHWLSRNGLDGATRVTLAGYQQTLHAWLLERSLPETIPNGTSNQKISETHLSDLITQLPYLTKRSYSVASITEDGQLDLIVRLVNKDNNTFGLSSGYLSHFCPVGSFIQGKIRSVSAHHHISASQPIILIGSGSGLAGLKAQIAVRNHHKYVLGHQAGATWLLYGERNSNPKLPLNKLLSTLETEHLTKLSRAYSQDSAYAKYVQHKLLDERIMLKEWVEDGATIYVCGCLSGMGEGVHQALLEVLGQVTLDELQSQQRYIRDVY